MRRFRIAFTGVFDIANYGDHLFPIIFQNEMEKRKLNFQLFLFSPFAGKEAFNHETDVFALRDLEKMHLQTPFDAIIVGGGEVIHFRQSNERLNADDEEYYPYPISQIWIIPSIVALKYNVPLIWNAPGANSFSFKEPYRGMTSSLCSSVDYLCVRNETSRNILEECGIDKSFIHLCPDTALLISDIISINLLEKLRDSLLPFSQRYVVFHTNRFITETGVKAVVKTLNSLEKCGYKIVLLPLAYSHGDDLILHKINQLAGNHYYEFTQALSLQDMMSVLACSSLYIGSSFHGCVTALAYGKRVAMFDIFQNKKTEDLLTSLNLRNHFIVEPELLSENVTAIINESFSIDLSLVKSKLRDHFNQIYKLIISPSKCNKTVEKFSVGYLKSMDGFRMILNEFSSSKMQSEEIKQIKEYTSTLEKQITEKNAYISRKEQECEKAQCYIKKMEVKLQENKALIAESKTQIKNEEQRHKRSENYLEKEKAKLFDQLNEQSKKIDKFENSFYGKIYKRLHN